MCKKKDLFFCHIPQKLILIGIKREIILFIRINIVILHRFFRAHFRVMVN